MRPKRKFLGIEVNPLKSRYICSSEVMFSKEGRGPDKEFFWRARDLSMVRLLSSMGNVPETEAELRLMAVTKLEVVSQTTFVQVQKWVEDNQPAGAGEREERSFNMTVESSAKQSRGRRSRRRKRWRTAIDAVALQIGL